MLGRTGTAPSMRYCPSDFSFLPVRDQDLPMLRDWLLRPHVAEWWGPAESIDQLRQDYVLKASEPNATRAYIAACRGRLIGFIQAYVVKDSGGGWWEDETDPGARGTDQFLAEPTDLGQGLGSSMIRAFLQYLFASPSVTVVQTDPSPDNARAIRSYEKAGFIATGPVITPDGPALLMRCTRQLFESLTERVTF